MKRLRFSGNSADEWIHLDLSENDVQLILLALGWFVRYTDEHGSAQRQPMQALDAAFRHAYDDWRRQRTAAADMRLEAAMLARHAGLHELAAQIEALPDPKP